MAAEETIAISFPDLSSAEATSLARELEFELLAEGVAADALRVARTDPEAMDLGGVLVLAGALGYSFVEEMVKGAGHEVGKGIGRNILKAVERVCARRGIAVDLKAANGTAWRIGEARSGSRSGDAGAIGALGLIVLGASVFPHQAGLDNVAFARSAAAIKDVFTAEATIFRRVEVLDLFDADVPPAEVVNRIEAHLDAHPDMHDLLIYYCGHGSFTQDRQYFLTLRGTRKMREKTTGLRLGDLRHDLEHRFVDKRLYMILDCCFASAGVSELMGDVDTMVETDVQQSLPPSGWAVLAASAPTSPAMAPEGQPLTMFTEALVSVAQAGIAGAGTSLSLADLSDASTEYIRDKHKLKAVLPQCHSPRQDSGDLARVQFLTNKSQARFATRRLSEPRHNGVVTTSATESRDKPLSLVSVCEFQGHHTRVIKCAFSPRQDLVLSFDANKTLKRWNVADGAEMPHIKNPTFRQGGTAEIANCDPLMQHCMLKIGSHGIFSSMDPSTNVPYGDAWNGHHAIDADAFDLSAGCRFWFANYQRYRAFVVMEAAGGRTFHSLVIHDYSTRFMGLFPHSPSQASQSVITNDNSKLVLVRQDGRLECYDLTKAYPQYSKIDARDAAWCTKVNKSVAIIACDHSNDIFALGFDDGSIQIRKTRDGSVISEIASIQGKISSLSFSLRRDLLAVGTSEGRLNIMELGGGIQKIAVIAHKAAVSCVAFTADGKRVVSGSHDTTLKLWRVEGI